MKGTLHIIIYLKIIKNLFKNNKKERVKRETQLIIGSRIQFLTWYG